MKRRKFLTTTAQAVSVAACSPLFSMVTMQTLNAQIPAPPGMGKSSKPQLALTLDDPRTNLENVMSWPEANSRLLKAISASNVRVALFVAGMRVDDAEGAKLISAWDQAGHIVANHSYSHLYYGPNTTYSEFAVDFLRNEKIIAPYHNRKQFFRYPFLKEGDSAAKRDQFRALLKERGYRVGHVTIDASDWYVDQRYRDRSVQQPKTPVAPYRDFLIAHLLDRATYYRQLAIDVLGRDIRHTILMHYTVLNALVLGDVMTAFERAGWQWIDASVAFEDPVFRSEAKTVPAGESLVWALAKETGKFPQLRYPGEDDIYERPKLDSLGL
ncbi:MAG TPA: polysaccharide deacetylase family protein [Candidatus Saccharimonadales bacterium]|nr:polysaccharide deacetylase family protein [Candidatus Saccharimonadales bacterium]